MEIISQELLTELSQEAERSPRSRKNHNFHRSASDPCHRMLNAFEPAAYVPPHRHITPLKGETFVILRGRLAVVEFEDDGRVCQVALLSAGQAPWGVHVAPGRFHTVLSLEPGTVVFEVKEGPFDVTTDKDVAPWAPHESDPAAPAWAAALRGLLALK